MTLQQRPSDGALLRHDDGELMAECCCGPPWCDDTTLVLKDDWNTWGFAFPRISPPSNPLWGIEYYDQYDFPALPWTFDARLYKVSATGLWYFYYYCVNSHQGCTAGSPCIATVNIPGLTKEEGYAGASTPRDCDEPDSHGQHYVLTTPWAGNLYVEFDPKSILGP